MEKLPNLVRNRLQASRSAKHPDPNLLNAFADQSLAGPERSFVLEHLARCSDCRQILALAAPELQPVAARPFRFDLVRASGSHWLRWPMLRWASLAACIVIVGAAATLYRGKSSKVAVDPYVAARNDAYSLPPKSANAGKANTAEAAASEPDSVGNVATKERGTAPGSVATADENRSSGVATKSKERHDYSASNKNGKREEAPGYLALKSGASGADEVAGANVRAPAPNAPPGIRSLSPEHLSKTASAGAVAAGPSNSDKLADQKTANARQVTNETVEVQTGTDGVELPPQSQTVSTIDSAAKSAKKSNARNLAPGPISTDANGLPQQNLAERAAIAPGASIMKDLVNARWTLSSEGLPQRSLDAGKTWEKMHVENLSGFRALSAAGLEVWVGGVAGVLYHTNDVGMHWNRVKPVADGSVLTADIVRIDFSDALRGKVTTADQHTWSTADGGKTWQKD